ncbi:hypothetical protein AB0N17_42650 [Streptomyces sp. NPDC051133]|uniref:hypothetical protein n=1 Tax=Streptomyces sp. NPDC051133 TaxID=3155521 RepID=UPI00342B5E49
MVLIPRCRQCGTGATEEDGRERLVEERLLSDALGRRLTAGGWHVALQYAYGAPPYGWQAHKKDLIEGEMEQAGRARARQLRDVDELSLRGICAVLEA